MSQVQEIEQASYTHEYRVSLKTATMVTLIVVVVMGALYGLLGFPPTFDGYYLKMYFHSIGIGLAALGVFLVIDAFKLQKYEPPLDFPLYYRALAAAGFAAAGGLVYLNAAIDTALPDVGLGIVHCRLSLDR